LEIKQNLFAAAAVFLSPGIPMIAQGQEMLRSKKGNHNSYNAGDAVNMVEYKLREKNGQVFAFYRDLIAFRLSKECELIRNSDEKTCRTTTFFSEQNHLAVGILRQSKEKPESQLLCLFNPHPTKPAVFSIKLPLGIWSRRVGNQRVFLPHGFDSREMILTRADGDGATIEIPPISVEAWVYRRK